MPEENLPIDFEDNDSAGEPGEPDRPASSSDRDEAAEPEESSIARPTPPPRREPEPAPEPVTEASPERAREPVSDESVEAVADALSPSEVEALRDAVRGALSLVKRESTRKARGEGPFASTGKSEHLDAAIKALDGPLMDRAAVHNMESSVLAWAHDEAEAAKWARLALEVAKAGARVFGA